MATSDIVKASILTSESEIESTFKNCRRYESRRDKKECVTGIWLELDRMLRKGTLDPPELLHKRLTLAVVAQKVQAELCVRKNHTIN